MRSIDIVWPMLGAVSLTLAAINALIGIRHPRQHAHLWFALAAVSVTILSVFELLMMRAGSPVAYAALLRWAHVPVATMFFGLVGFVFLHFQAGRPWLASLVVGLRLGSLLPNFLTGANLNFASVESLRAVVLWNGETLTMPIGTANPWMLVGQVSNWLFVCYVLDAMVTVTRRGEPWMSRQAILVCGSLAVFVATSSVWTALVSTGIAAGPLTVNVVFFIVVLAMSYVLGDEVFRAVTLARHLAASRSELHDNERHMQLAARAAGLALWTWDLGAQRYWFTESSRALFGFAPDETIPPGGLRDRIHPDDIAALDAARQRSIGGNPGYESEFRVRDASGQWRWIAAIGQVEYDTSGGAKTIRGVAIDVSGRREADERVRRVLEASPTAMLVVEPEGCVRFANGAAAALFGAAADGLAGRRIGTLLPTAAPNATAGAPPVVGAHPLVQFALRSDGQQRLVELTRTPIRLGEEELLIVCVTDVEERRRLEREAAMQRDELAHLSRVALLGELSGSIAHELNQPLTAVLSNAQAALRFLDRSPPDLGEVRESLVQIVENDKRAGDVIRRLRAMLRKEQADYQRLNLDEVIVDAIRLVNSDLLNRSVVVTLSLHGALPDTLADRVQIQQVVLNLVINACDAMEHLASGRSLDVSTSITDEGDVRVAVSDVGRGIAEADLERIFVPFVTSKPDGIGLGLPICRTILDAHGGSLWATNNATGGATLQLVLPAVGAEGTLDRSNPREAPRPRTR